jgi:hypothetical protein
MLQREPVGLVSAMRGGIGTLGGERAHRLADVHIGG